jgi:hypothetical protein
VGVVGLVGTAVVSEAEGEGRDVGRETSVNPSTFRIDGVNELAIIYLTRQLETVRFEGQGEEVCEAISLNVGGCRTHTLQLQGPARAMQPVRGRRFFLNLTIHGSHLEVNVHPILPTL